MVGVMGMVSVVGLLRPSGNLLLSTDEVLPVTFFDARGSETADIASAVSGAVIYRDCHQTFALDEVDHILVN